MFAGASHRSFFTFTEYVYEYDCESIIILIIANKRKNDETFVIFIVFA